MKPNSPLVRLIAAAAIIGVAVFALWQGGVLFQPTTATVTTSDGEIKVTAAETNVDTPPVAGHSVGLEVGQIAPDFEFSTFDGERMRLSDLRGQAVFLNFWASWCGPCRQEMPDMQTMLEKYGSQGLVILGMNSGEALSAANRFIERIKITLSDFGYDPNSDVARRYAVTGLPISYFIDSTGVITRVTSVLSFNVMESSVQEVIAGYKAISN